MSHAADNLKGSSGYSTPAIPPSLLSGSGSANDSKPSSAGGSDEPSSSASSAPTPEQPSIDLDSADMGSSGMDLAKEFSKLAQARSNRSGKDGRASNPADDMLAFDLIPSTPTSDAEAYMSDDEPLFDLPASSGTSDDEEGSGNSIQEGLAEVVNMEVRKQQFKEGFLDELEGKKDNLRSIGEQIKEELAAKLEIDKMRAELASSVAMSDTMEKFDALEAEIRGIQEQLKADEADLQAFEERNAEERSKALFFKGLYVAPKKKKVDASTSGSSSSGQTGASSGSGGVAGPQDALPGLAGKLEGAQPTDSLRLYLFASLAAGCCAVVAADLASGDPSIGPDLLFGGLAALLVLTAVQEQRSLNKGGASTQADSSDSVNSYDGRDKGSRRR
ncbi:MAG: hypothetical protein WDW36_008125 [Sanguina aurantia]